MESSPKVVREHIARCKFFLQRKDLLRSLRSLAKALELLRGGRIFGRERIEIDILLEEAVRLLAEQDSVRLAFPAGLNYKKGHERELAATLTRLADALEAVLEKARIEARRRRLAGLDELILAAQAELEQKQSLEARKHFRHAAELYGDVPGLFVDIGRRLLLGGVPAEAAEYFQKGIETAPNDERAYGLLVQCLDALREPAKAEETARATLRRFGPREAFYLRLARGALARRNWDEALDNARAAMRITPGPEARRLAEKASEGLFGDPQAYKDKVSRPAVGENDAAPSEK